MAEIISGVRLGTVLAGKYELHAPLGKGGMGIVFRGRHSTTGRPIAVKVLRPDLTSDTTLAKRFMREAKAAAALQHPNVVDILDYGVEPDGTAYQVLELLEGESLREHLARKGETRLDVTLSLMLPVIHALAMAHDRGVIHRDIKPDNIFLARNAHGRVVPKLLDFGIAKLVRKDGTASSTIATRSGAAVGTPAYMSPEQAGGVGEVGVATDVWAIGVILFECLAGRIPFEAETGSILMARIITEQAESLGKVVPSVPAPIVAVIDRALRSDQTERWPDMTTFGDALRAAAAESGVAIAPPGASDVAPLSLPPPRMTVDRPLEDEEPISSGGGGDDDAAPRETGERAVAAPRKSLPTIPDGGRAPTRQEPAEPVQPTEPAASRPSRLVPVVAVSLLLAVLVCVGLWMQGEDAAEPGAAAGSTPASAAPPVAARPPAVVPEAQPVAPPSPGPTPDPVPTAAAPVDPPAGAPATAELPRRPRATDSAHAPVAPPSHAPPHSGRDLPELTEW